MNKGELQYISDSLLIEKLAAMEFGIVKEAGIFDMLGGVASSIKNQVQEHVSKDHPGGVAGGVLSLMAPAVLFRLHPLLGILYLIGTAFGFDITTIFGKIMALIKPKLESGQSISPEEVNDIGKSVVASVAGPMEATASSDLLEHLRINPIMKIAQKSDLSSFLREMTNSQNSAAQALPKVPWLMGDKGASPIQSIFGELFQQRRTGKAKWLLGGFVVWIIKTILAGAGLLAVTGAVSNMLGHKTDNANQKSDVSSKEKNETVPASTDTKTTVPDVQLKASGRGEQVFTNDANNIWVIPLVSASIPDTLITWAIDVYPSLQGHDNEIESSPSFQRLVNLLHTNQKPTSPNNLVMPKGYTSRKQVVDSFIGDVARSLK